MKLQQTEEIGCALMILAVGLSIGFIILAVSFLPHDFLFHAGEYLFPTKK